MWKQIGITLTYGLVLILASAQPGSANDNDEAVTIELPEVHMELALQSDIYSNGDSTYFAGMAKRAHTGFTIREAKVVIEGVYEDYLEYNLEMGTAACLDGGFMVLEAGIFLKPLAHVKLGVTKGHVLRGFEMYHDCVHLLTAEKPIFATEFSPCHPLGATVEFEQDFDDNSGILAQLVVAEGSGGTADEEHDINMGVHYRTPIPGLTLAGSYTFWKWNAVYMRKDSVQTPGGARDDYTYFFAEERTAYDGYRAIFGVDYENHDLSLRAEGFTGKAFKDALDMPYYADIWADSSNTVKITGAPFEDLEMRAMLVQGGYKVPLRYPKFRYIQPYVQYQWWDQASNLDNGDYASSFFTIGVNIGVGSGSALFKLDYQTCIDFADDGGIPGYGEEQHADRVLARLQIGI